MRKSYRFTTKIEKFCSNCKDYREYCLVNKDEVVKVKDTFVKYVAQGYTCSTCGDFFVPSEIEEQNFIKSYSVYREAHNLLQIEDIRKIRSTYGLSQKDFSRFLAWGDITIHRYESGALQDQAHNQVLEFISDPQNALNLFEKNKKNLSKSVAVNLEKLLISLVMAKKQPFRSSNFRFPEKSIPKNLFMARHRPAWERCAVNQ